MQSRVPTETARDGGFALVIVLWTLVLIAFLVARLSTAGSVEIQIAANLAANAAAQTAADGAIFQAIFNLSTAVANDDRTLDEAPREIQIGRNRVTLLVENEAARINPNLASPALMEGLLRVFGGDREQSAMLAGRIAEWVGKPVDLSNPAYAKDQAFGVAYRPPRSPLQSLDELARVRGMTPALFTLLRPHLTLFGPSNPDTTAADPEVAAAIGISSQVTANPGAAAAPPSEGLTVRIHVSAKGPDNALLTRTAVVRIGSRLANGYSVLAWNSGDEPFE